MGALVIRNLPDDVHASLKRMAAEHGQALEAFVRERLADVARRKPHGIDFERLMHARAAVGLYEDGPEWREALDDAKLSRKVLGLKKPKGRTTRRR